MDIREKMNLLKETRVISWHEHINYESHVGNPNYAFAQSFVNVLDTLGVDMVVSSVPVAANKHCTPEEFIAANDLMFEMTQLYPGRVFGQAFVNPGYQKEMLHELDRCVKELGFVGVKLYHQYRMDDPVQFALVEKLTPEQTETMKAYGESIRPITRNIDFTDSDETTVTVDTETGEVISPL